MKKHTSPKSRSLAAHLLRVGTASVLTLGAMGAVTTGCLDRPVSPVAPETTNIFVDRITVSMVDKIDLLFMVDNSISMADKQNIMGEAVPQLLNRLVDPVCVDANSKEPVVPTVTDSQGCPENSEPEFRKVDDIHIGVVTSSLGSHGGVTCSQASKDWVPDQNDFGRLISRALEGAPPASELPGGFLSWDPVGTAKNPGGQPGISDAGALGTSFTSMVTGAGEIGCGYEASLEAWYRFLIDPEPYESVVVPEGQQQAQPVGVDGVLLDQRAQFLRPDSLVAIIMLTDENDCSILDWGHGHYAAGSTAGALPRSTSICDQDPNDECCMACTLANVPGGCDPPNTDVKCQQAEQHIAVSQQDDALNLRCWDQKRRFGLDFLYPTQRYVDGLTMQEVPKRDGTMARNPLFAESSVYPTLVPRMDSSLVFLAGIVGVPWQDIVTDESLGDPKKIEYLTAAEIASRGIWDEILGDPDAHPPVPPIDPFMLESVEQRAGVNPRTGIAIQQTQATAPGMGLGPGGNLINGHEYVIGHKADLQYACIFPLDPVKDCTPVGDTQVVPSGCDCGSRGTDVLDRPLCDGNMQSFAKAYPGTRILKVLEDYGTNSIVASICPKNIHADTLTDPDYGYNPAVAAIIDRLKEALTGTCLPRPLDVNEQGEVACEVVEVTRTIAPAPCEPSLQGRDVVHEEVAKAVLKEMERLGMCGDVIGCDEFALCKLTPVDPANLNECLTIQQGIQNAFGYCYIDAMRDLDKDGKVCCESALEPPPNCNPELDPCNCDTDRRRECIGNPELVDSCAASERRLLRFVSPDDQTGNVQNEVPWPQSTVFVACQGATI
jgi:hypothetical protein